MNPRNFFIISPSKSWANSIKRYIEWNIGANTSIIEIPLFKEEETLDIFNFISTELEKNDSSVLRNSIAILDGCFWESNLNLLVDPPNRSTLTAMLALAFPEVHWIFVVMMRDVAQQFKKNKFFYLQEKLSEFFNEINSISSPLFDPYGLRNKIRENMKNTIIGGMKEALKYLKLRNDEISASIDEEEAYAYLHGYVAYKMGHRCYTVTTEKEMKNLTSDNLELNIVFEDIFLNFPDRGTGGLSDLEHRDRMFRHLRNTPTRILVSVGHRFAKAYEKNKIYIKKLKIEGKRIKNVYKPSGGIYNLLNDADLLKYYWKRKNQEWKEAEPEMISKSETQQEETTAISRHSAPGRLLLIAEKLINRAEKILHEAKSVQECIHGSLLTLEAQELLGYKTPTTCLEAIALRHQLEVKAECMFYGVSYNIDLKNRFKEIEKEVEAVSKWFHPSVKKKASLNAQMGIITELMEIFRDFGQFDEEQECLKRFRKIRRKWFYANKPLFIIFRPLHAYIETLASSFLLFLLAIITIPFVISLLQYFLSPKCNKFTHYLQEAYISFFSLQPCENIFTQGEPLTLVLIIGGFIHLGIFISFVYSLIARK
jgi:hypothetical protein